VKKEAEMSSNGAKSSRGLEWAELIPPLRRMYASDNVVVIEAESQAPAGIGTTGAAVVRLAGSAVVDGQHRPWSLIRKRLVSPESRQADPSARQEAPSGVNYWKREFALYQSGLLDALPDGFSAPLCFHVEETSDACTFWMEEVGDEIPIWPLSGYGVAAQHLGLFNGLSLTTQPLPTYPWFTVDIQRQRERTNGGFFSNLEQRLQHPIVRAGWPDDVAEGILRIWQERELFYQMLDQLPRVLQHGDAVRRNLMSRTSKNGQLETVAIDWGYAGVGALGEEIASTLVSAPTWFQGVTPAQLPEMQEIIFDGYLEGLQQAGWRGDPNLALLGYLCTVALRYGPMIVVPETMALTQEARDRLKQWTGHSIEEWSENLVSIRRFVIQQADKARQLWSK
jgi:hypothetical protein